MNRNIEYIYNVRELEEVRVIVMNNIFCPVNENGHVISGFGGAGALISRC